EPSSPDDAASVSALPHVVNAMADEPRSDAAPSDSLSAASAAGTGAARVLDASDAVATERVEMPRAAPAIDVALPDAEARAYATDPRRNVVLEASAGTGKTSVLVARYLNLLSLDVDPANILAITFTRKAAAEMRERIVTALRRASIETAEGRTR